MDTNISNSSELHYIGQHLSNWINLWSPHALFINLNSSSMKYLDKNTTTNTNTVTEGNTKLICIGIYSLAATGKTIEANVPFINLHLREAMDRNATTNTATNTITMTNTNTRITCTIICSLAATGRTIEANMPFINLHLREAMDRNTTTNTITNTNQEHIKIQNLYAWISAVQK